MIKLAPVPAAADNAPALTEPPNPPKPYVPSWALAIAYLASGEPIPAHMSAAVDALRTEGWTTRSAYAEIHRTGPALRVIAGGGELSERPRGPEPAEKPYHAATTATTNAVTNDGSACPPWCLVETEFSGHDDWDGGEMCHWWCGSVELSAWSCESGGKQYCESLDVARKQVRDDAPVIEIAIPYRNDNPSTIGALVQATTVLTMDEAAKLIAELQKAVSPDLTAED